MIIDGELKIPYRSAFNKTIEEAIEAGKMLAELKTS
jgi:hypothetical protein